MTREVCACHYYPLELCPGEEAVKISEEITDLMLEEMIKSATSWGKPLHVRALRELQSLRAEVEKLRDLVDHAAGQMECLQKNLHKGMSKSIQKMQGFALLETAAELRAARGAT